MGLGIAVLAGKTANDTLAQADQVEVWEHAGAPAGYRIRVPVDVVDGDLPLLFDASLDPGSELTILEDVDDQQVCLVKGPVRGQYIHFEHGGEGSWVEVVGSDTTIKMDRETRATIFSNVKDSEAVQTVLSDSRYGYALDVQDTPSKHVEEKHVLVQRETDAHFVRRLAGRNGYLFWVTCDAEGAETAHFRRPPLDGAGGAPTGAAGGLAGAIRGAVSSLVGAGGSGGDVELLLNVDGANLKSAEIAFDVERPTSVVGAGLDTSTKDPIDGTVGSTPQTLLGERGLQAITGDTRSAHLWAPADDRGDLQARGEGLLIEADWFVRLTCQTSLNTLGTLVRSHTVVKVDGLGSRHSGKYFVAAVHHTIDAGGHKMDLTLVRNGLSR